MTNKRPIHDQFLNELRAIVGENNLRSISSTDDENRDYQTRFIGNASYVIEPNSSHEVAAVVHICQRENIPVTARGGGSGLTGAAVPLHLCVAQGDPLRIRSQSKTRNDGNICVRSWTKLLRLE